MTTSSASSTRIWILVVVLFAAVIAGVTWVNYHFALQNPGGNDFLVHWEGTRSFILEGLSPYSDEVATRIQTLAYGRPAQPGEHELRVAYPLYSALLFAPFALIKDYNLARAVWMTVLEVSLALLAWVSLRLSGWKPRLLMLVVYFLFSFLWYHSVRPLINGNVVIIVALLIALALQAIRDGRDELAGVLLGFATIKPQLALLIIIFVFFWAISCRRWRLAIAVPATILILSAISFFFIPDWILQNLREVMHYPGYNPAGTPGAVFIQWLPGVGRQLSAFLSIFLGLVLLIEWFVARGKGDRWFIWTACLTLVASQWIGIQTDPGNFVILFPPLVLMFGMLDERWGAAIRWVILTSMIILGVGLWALFLRTVGQGTQPLQNPVMFFPLPLFLFIGLYWVRWLAIGPRRPLMDRLRASQKTEIG